MIFLWWIIELNRAEKMRRVCRLWQFYWSQFISRAYFGGGIQCFFSPAFMIRNTEAGAEGQESSQQRFCFSFPVTSLTGIMGNQKRDGAVYSLKHLSSIPAAVRFLQQLCAVIHNKQCFALLYFSVEFIPAPGAVARRSLRSAGRLLDRLNTPPCSLFPPF